MEGYKVIKALGQGTWGVVRMAEQKNTGRIVAIKKIKSEKPNEGIILQQSERSNSFEISNMRI